MSGMLETREFISDFDRQTPPPARWRKLAERKLVELKAERAHRDRPPVTPGADRCDRTRLRELLARFNNNGRDDAA